MILRRLFMAIAAAAAIGAAAASCVVAAAFAVYALLRPFIGPAGASASVAAIVAAFAVIVAIVATSGTRRPSKTLAGERDPIALAERLMAMVRERPWAAGVGAVALCLMALRNPAIMEAVARAFFNSQPATRKRRSKDST